MYNTILALVSCIISAFVCGVSITLILDMSRGPDARSQGYTHTMHWAMAEFITIRKAPVSFVSLVPDLTRDLSLAGDSDRSS